MNYLPIGKNHGHSLRVLVLDKIWLIMKISIFLLLVFVTAGHAKSMAQKISLSLKNTTLETVFSAITAQTKHRFLYSDDVVKKAGMVNVELREVSIEEALEQVLKNRELTYRIIAETVIINEKAAKAPDNASSQQTVSGVVRDANGETLSGVTVSIKGQPGSLTTTNPVGGFRVTVPVGTILVFSYVGYSAKEVTVGDNTIINVTLEELVRELGEVEVVRTGYQTLDRKLFTGAAANLKAEDVQRNGIPDISRMLEGQVAGVAIQNVSGTFGAAPRIRIRGATSISGDNKPLWVVDGIILEDVVNISNEQLTTGDASTLIGSSVAGLNPDDIESFNILKDAAATALYGARAMNGVIIVTTKKGRNSQGKPQFSYSGNFTTYLKPSYSQFDIMNSGDQMALLIELENKGYYNHSRISRSRHGGVFYKMYNQMYDYNENTDSFALRNDMDSRINFLNRYANANTDWFDILFNNSLLQEHSFSVSSGTERSQLYASTSYLQDHGWTIADNVKRFTGNIRGNFHVNDKLSVELISTASIRDQTTPGTLGREMDAVTGRFTRAFDINPFSYSLNTSRLITPYDERGNREFFVRDWAPFNILHEIENNTLALTMIDFKMQGGLKYNIFDGLSYAFDGAYRYAKTDREHMVTEYSNMAMAHRAASDATIRGANEFLYANPDFPNDLRQIVLPDGGFYNTEHDGITNYYLRNTLEYNKTFREIHQVNFFGSAEMRYTDRQNRNMEGVGYQYDRGGVPSIDPLFIKWRVEASKPYYGNGYNYERFLAYMSRAAYSFKGRYSVNATLRYDGSNLMGDEPTARWLPTWNISGAWNIDEESFFPKTDFFMDYVRIRGTYGLVGSLGSANNSSLVLMNQQTRRPYLTEVETALIIQGLKNSELTWEKLYETNIGVDLSLFSEKLDLTVDLYKRNIFDLIGAFRTSGIGGQFTKMANYGDMEGRGVEVTLGSQVFGATKLKWRTQLNFANHVNKITNLDNNPNIWSLVNQDGGPRKGYPHRGLFSIKFDGLDPEYGIPYFINENGERSTNVYYQSTTGVDHLVYEGPVDPTLTGGFYNQFSYKNFSLSFLLTFSAGNYIRLDPGYTIDPSDMFAVTNDYLRRFIMPGDESNIPGMIDYTIANDVTGYPYNAFNYSTERVAKGDFIRFKQFAFSYRIPTQYTQKFGFNNIAVSLVGNNIALLYSDSRLNGQDPEFFGSGGVALPIPRQFTLNLKLGF